MALDYCGCPAAQPKPVQLLRARLFPSTVTDPKTAATFIVLKQFQLLSFSSKISGYEFYNTLARMTDNTGVKPPPVSVIFHLYILILILFLRIGTLCS